MFTHSCVTSRCHWCTCFARELKCFARELNCIWRRMDRRLIFLLNVAHRRVQRFVATQAPKGVTATQAGLLFVLGRRDGVLLGEAGAALDLGMPGISGLVERMVE